LGASTDDLIPFGFTNDIGCLPLSFAKHCGNSEYASAFWNFARDASIMTKFTIATSHGRQH
jgi:hypothetical protein